MTSLTAIKQEPILVLSEALNELIETHSWSLRELLVAYKIPKESWNDLWGALAEEETPGAFAELDEDLDIQRIVGWFEGVATTLGTEEAKLVTL